jgi:hypothetical protein
VSDTNALLGVIIEAVCELEIILGVSLTSIF